MSNIALSEARVMTLKPRKSAYDIRDAKLRGFGVRVLPSGARRFFMHTQHRGERIWKIVRDANAMTLAEARARVASMLAAIRRDALGPSRRQGDRGCGGANCRGDGASHVSTGESFCRPK